MEIIKEAQQEQSVLHQETASPLLLNNNRENTPTEPEGSNPTSQDRLSYSNSKPIVTVSAIAKDLNIHTFQGVVESNSSFIVPTLDNRLLQVSPDGVVSTVVQFCKGFECERFGAPFGIASSNDSLIVTISDYSFGGRLLQVSPDGKFSKIAELTDLSKKGGPFGVATSGSDFIVTIASDAMESQGLLVRVSADGTLRTIADLSEFGIPFAVTVSDGSFVVTTERGVLVRVSSEGKVTRIADLVGAGLGIPLGVVASRDSFIVTTNKGLLVRVSQTGSLSTLTDLAQADFGIPSAIIESGDSFIVTTNAGYLLRVNL